MWSHLGIETLGYGGDLLGLKNAPRAAQRRLQNSHTAGAQQGGKLRLGGQPLTGSHRYAALLGHIGKLQQVIRRAGLFKPQRIIGFQSSRQANSARGGELPVSTKENIGAVPHRFTYAPTDSDRALYIAQRGLVTTAHGIRASRVELHSSKPLLHHFCGTLSRHLGIIPKSVEVMMR